jgi:hypothetical protein
MRVIPAAENNAPKNHVIYATSGFRTILCSKYPMAARTNVMTKTATTEWCSINSFIIYWLLRQFRYAIRSAVVANAVPRVPITASAAALAVAAASAAARPLDAKEGTGFDKPQSGGDVLINPAAPSEGQKDQ